MSLVTTFWGHSVHYNKHPGRGGAEIQNSLCSRIYRIYGAMLNTSGIRASAAGSFEFDWPQ